MQATALPIEGLWLIQPQTFSDARGFFFESYNHKKFCDTIGYQVNFVQDNHSLSHKDTARGFHYQLPPYAQAKLVRVVSGAVIDIALDIRRHSKSFGECYAVLLSAENKRQFWLPHGFAHAFITLEDNTEFLYKTDNYYAPEYEGAISLCDPALTINYPSECNPLDSFALDKLLMSEKDKTAPTLQDAPHFP